MPIFCVPARSWRRGVDLQPGLEGKGFAKMLFYMLVCQALGPAHLYFGLWFPHLLKTGDCLQIQMIKRFVGF